MRFRFLPVTTVLLVALPPGVYAQAQRPALVFDLPLPPWGFASRLSDAPTFLADRARDRVFVFPLIVGQKRTEIAFSPFSKGAIRRPERVVLTRRSLGISPANAEKDDRDGANARRWRVHEADTRHALTRFACEFPAVAPSQRIISGDKPAELWTPGTAELTLYPGNASEGMGKDAFTAEGLLVEVKLTNASGEPQTYFVDAVIAMEPDFSRATPQPEPRLSVFADASILTAFYPEVKLAFAISGDDGRFAPHAYRVTSDYFAATADLEKLTDTGGSLPNGLPNDLASNPGSWGLWRLDNIRVPARGSVTVRFCIGAGHNPEAAKKSSESLFGVASDLLPDGSKRDTPGLKSLAQKAHGEATRSAGSTAFDALLTRSLVTMPFEEVGRLATLTRSSIPTPEASAALVAGWACADPEFAAAQAIDSLVLVAALPVERRADALLNLLTALDAIPPDIRRFTALKSAFLPFSEIGKSLPQPVSYPIAALLERLAVETGAEKPDEDFWRTVREKSTAGYVLPILDVKPNTQTPFDFLKRWTSALEIGNAVPVLTEAKTYLSDFETAAQNGTAPLDSLALLPLSRLLHTPGTVTHGRFVSLLGVTYDEKKDELRFGVRAIDAKPAGVILLRMGKPNTLYHLTGVLDAKPLELKSDETGILTLPISANSNATRSVEVK